MIDGYRNCYGFTVARVYFPNTFDTNIPPPPSPQEKINLQSFPPKAVHSSRYLKLLLQHNCFQVFSIFYGIKLLILQQTLHDFKEILKTFFYCFPMKCTEWSCLIPTSNDSEKTSPQQQYSQIRTRGTLEN